MVVASLEKNSVGVDPTKIFATFTVSGGWLLSETVTNHRQQPASQKFWFI